MNQEQLFKSVEKLIYSQAWHYSKKFGVDFEDIRSEGYEIFCKAVKKFDKGKDVKFSTYLFHQLRILGDKHHQKKYYEQRGIRFNIDIGTDFLGTSRNNNNSQRSYDDRHNKNRTNYINITEYENLESSSPADRILFNSLVTKLSDDGQKVMAGLLYGSFNEPNTKYKKPIGKGTIHKVCSKKLGWPAYRIEAVWNELSQWWGENEVLIACN